MNVLIVDDDPLICKSLALMLAKEPDIQVIGAAYDGRQAIEMCETNPPDLVLMDIRMPEVDGIQATRLLKKLYPRVRVMMLTTFKDKPNIERALKAGADGYLLKTDPMADIAAKLRILAHGAAVMDSEALKTLTSTHVSSLELLTPRERSIVELVTQGMTNKEIAQHLFLSEGTVRNVLSVVMDKLNVKNRTQLGLAALGREGTANPPSSTCI
ncbi:MAG: two-component response regulator [Bacillota bacterium]|nr:MAG: two-component response regulator [Bacillota bacterium]